MDRYRFPLQKLLDMRSDKEEKSKQSFIEAERQKKIVEDRLKTLSDNYNKYKDIGRNESIVEQKIRHNYLFALNIGINNTNKELDKKASIVEEKRGILKQDQIARKTVEILKNKKQEAFNNEKNRIEQIKIDEYALYSHLRRVKEGE
jgi:flagellar protein FliJ